MTTKDRLEMEISCSRSYLVALQYIAEMVGLDTSNEPHEGVNDVVRAVEAFVAEAGGGLTLKEARERVGSHWIDEQIRNASPSPTDHERGAAAYYAVIRS